MEYTYLEKKLFEIINKDLLSENDYDATQEK